MRPRACLRNCRGNGAFCRQTRVPRQKQNPYYKNRFDWKNVSLPPSHTFFQSSHLRSTCRAGLHMTFTRQARTVCGQLLSTLPTHFFSTCPQLRKLAHACGVCTSRVVRASARAWLRKKKGFWEWLSWGWVHRLEDPVQVLMQGPAWAPVLDPPNFGSAAG